jgi:hypothetical protein
MQIGDKIEIAMTREDWDRSRDPVSGFPERLICESCWVAQAVSRALPGYELAVGVVDVCIGKKTENVAIELDMDDDLQRAVHAWDVYGYTQFPGEMRGTLTVKKIGGYVDPVREYLP